MAKNSSLEYLRPHGGKHAILEAVITLALTPDSALPPFDQFKALHKRQFIKDFPSFKPVMGASFEIGSDISGQFAIKQQGVPSGFSFEMFNADGKLNQRLRYEKGPQTWIAVNFLHYSRWSTHREQAKAWLETLAKRAMKYTPKRDVKVSGLSLHYIDHLHWETDTQPPLKDIFKPTSKFLPARLQENVFDWQSRVAYKRLKNGLMHTDLVSVLAQVKPENGHRRFIIDIPLHVALSTPISLGEFLSDNGTYGFIKLADSLHSDNKSYVIDIISRKVCKMIGLNQ